MTLPCLECGSPFEAARESHAWCGLCRQVRQRRAAAGQPQPEVRPRACLGCGAVWTPRVATARRCASCRKAHRNAQQREWNGKPENRARKNALHRQRRYARAHELAKFGLTIEGFEEMVADRDGRCDICRRKRQLCVDHDHQTGLLRGLLCRPCNRALGLLGDTIDSVGSAVAYMEKGDPG